MSTLRIAARSAILLVIGVALLCAMLPGAIVAGIAIPRNSLRVVVQSCLAAQRFVALSLPCLSVGPKIDGRVRYVVLRVPASRTHLLVVPADAIPGIEDRRLQQPPYGQLWSEALKARSLVSEGAGFAVPQDGIGLAVNADHIRSQDQLHVHVECIRPRYLQAIRAQAAGVGSDWSAKPVLAAGDRFAVRRVDRTEIDGGNLFASLAEAPSLDGSLTNVGAILVAETASSDDRMLLLAAIHQRQSVEKLLDHECARTKRVVEAGR